MIGGEGAIVLGGLAAAVAGVSAADLPVAAGFGIMVASAMTVGGARIGLAGALRVRRGVNETISSLLLAYIAIAIFNHLVETVFRDPASLNKPSTTPLPGPLRVGDMPMIATHWGIIVAGIAGCGLAWVLMERTTVGFAARITGDNARAAEVQGLPVDRLVIGFTAIGGPSRALPGSSRSPRSTVRPMPR